jgi:hypothetical protein
MLYSNDANLASVVKSSGLTLFLYWVRKYPKIELLIQEGIVSLLSTKFFTGSN